MSKLNTLEALSICHTTLNAIKAQLSPEVQDYNLLMSIIETTLKVTNEEHVDNESLINARRYECLSSAIYHSDGRPYIARNIYDNGKFIKSEPLTGEDAQQYIDPLIDMNPLGHVEIERMKKALDQESIMLPPGLSMEDFTAFVDNAAQKED